MEKLLGRRHPPQQWVLISIFFQRVNTSTFLADLRHHAVIKSGERPGQQEHGQFIHLMINIVTHWVSKMHPSWSWGLPEMFWSQSHTPAPGLWSVHACVV